MGAFEDFVNANLGVRMPLFIDTTTPELSSKSAGSLGSKFVDSTTNYLYEKTGYTNADWVKIAELGESRGGGGGSIDISGGYNITIDEVGSTYIVNLRDPITGTFRVQDSEIIGTGNGIPFAVSESGQVGLNLFTGENQVTGFLTPYHLHVSGATALSGSINLTGGSSPALTVVGNTELEGNIAVDNTLGSPGRFYVETGVYLPNLTTAQRDGLDLYRDGSGALIFNSDSEQLQVHDGTTWRTLSGGALGSGVAVVANIGAGSGIASGVTGDVASFKSLIGGTNLQILGDATSLTLNVTGISGGSATGITGATNLGAGSGLISGITDNDLQVKSLVGGTNLQITGDGESLYLNVTGISGADGSGVSSFTGLSDTPSSFEANQFLRVSSDATGLIYNDLSGVITSETLDWLVYSTVSDLPSATYHHGMFAHVHAEDAAYMAHAGNWVKIYPLVTGAEGLGDGSGVFKEISSYNLQFKSLLGGDNVRITGDGSTLTFDVTGISGGSTTGITGASNIGAGSGLISGITDNDLQVKSLVGGTNLQITGDGESLYLNVTGVSGSTVSGITGASNIGSGSGVFSGISDNDLVFRTIEGGSNVSIVESNSGWRIDASTTNVTVTGGTVSGGLGSNPYFTGESNFYTLLPDQLALTYAADGAAATFHLNWVNASNIYYRRVVDAIQDFVFNNDSAGTYSSTNGISASDYGGSFSLSGALADGRGVYLGGGGSGSSSSSTTGITGATNLGAGSGLISGITDNDLQVKSLVGGTNLQITGDGESLYLNVTGVSGSTVSGITGVESLGAGSALASGVSGSDLYLKSLVGGTNVTLSSDDNTITINAAGGGGGGAGGSGGIGGNSFIEARSNFYTGIPDQIILDIGNPATNAIPYQVYNVDDTKIEYTWSSPSALYRLIFDNDTTGAYSSSSTATEIPELSLSGYIASGRAVYLGGGGSGSSSSSCSGILNYRGAFVEGTDYEANDFVTYNGKSYIATAATNGFDPSGYKSAIYVDDGDSTDGWLARSPATVSVQTLDGNDTLKAAGTAATTIYVGRNLDLSSYTGSWTDNTGDYVVHADVLASTATPHLVFTYHPNSNDAYSFWSTNVGADNPPSGIVLGDDYSGSGPAAGVVGQITGRIAPTGTGLYIGLRTRDDTPNTYANFDNIVIAEDIAATNPWSLLAGEIAVNNCGSGSSTTGITGATNLGAGSGLISGITDNDLQVKSLVGGTNLQITGDGESLYLNVTGVSGSTVSGITGVESLGAGSALASGVSGSDLYLKSLVGGTNVTLSSDDNTITINAAGGGGGGSSSNGALGSNSLYSGISNFSGVLPDALIMDYANGPSAGGSYYRYELNWVNDDYIYYYDTYSFSATAPSWLKFNNDVSGTYNTARIEGNTPPTASNKPLNISISEFIDSGRAVYYGGSSNGGGGGGGGGGGSASSVSGGVNSNPAISALSNFTGTLPDTLLLQNTSSPVWYITFDFYGIETGPAATSQIQYRATYDDINNYIMFDNDSSGKFATKSTAFNWISGQPNCLQDMIDDGLAIFTVAGGSGSSSSTTGITGATNLGAGSGLISGITDNDLQVKSLVGGTNLQITGDGESLYLNVTGVSGSTVSGITGASNIGNGSGVLSGISDNELVFRTLEAGSNIFINTGVDGSLSISASTTDVTVTGGSVSGGIGANPYVTGKSNFYTELPDEILVDRTYGDQIYRFGLNAVSTSFTHIYYYNSETARYYRVTNNAEGTYEGFFPTNDKGFSPTISLSGMIASGRAVYLGGGGSSSDPDCTGCGIPVSSTFTGRMPKSLIADYYYNGGAQKYKIQVPFFTIGVDGDAHIYFEQYNPAWQNGTAGSDRLVLKFNDDAEGTVDAVTPSAGTWYFPTTTRTLSDYIASGDVTY